VKSNTFFYRT